MRREFHSVRGEQTYGEGSIKTTITGLPNAGSAATITISRPEKLNALSSSLLPGIRETISGLADTHKDLCAIILTGEGTKAFVGGADITEMAKLSSPAEAREFIRKIHNACQTIRDCPIPVIARINGIALGAGLEIAASCDLRVASSNAIFGMPEVRMGLPSVVEAALLPSLIGWGRTRQLLYLGDMLPAEEAQRWGLVERVVQPDKLDDAIAQWLDSLQQCGPESIRNQKELMRRWEQVGIESAIELGIDHFGRAFETRGGSEQPEPNRMMGEFLKRQSERKNNNRARKPLD